METSGSAFFLTPSLATVRDLTHASDPDGRAPLGREEPGMECHFSLPARWTSNRIGLGRGVLWAEHRRQAFEAAPGIP